MFTQSTQIIYHTIPHCCNEWSIGAIVKKSSVFLLVYQFLWKPSPVYPDCTTAIDPFVIQSQIHFSTSVLIVSVPVMSIKTWHSSNNTLEQRPTSTSDSKFYLCKPTHAFCKFTHICGITHHSMWKFYPPFCRFNFILSSKHSIPLYIFHIPCSICMSPFSSIRNSCSYTYSYIPRTPSLMSHIHFQLIFCFLHLVDSSHQITEEQSEHDI